MSKIIQPDQFITHYAYEKETNPDAQIVLRQFRRKYVEAIDHIVELAHGERDFVTSDSDRKVMEELIKFFAEEWPEEFAEFKATILDIRSTRNEGGYSENKEMKYVGAIPPRLAKMMKAIFPAQQWDKKFVNKLVKKFPLFNVGGVV